MEQIGADRERVVRQAEGEWSVVGGGQIPEAEREVMLVAMGRASC